MITNTFRGLFHSMKPKVKVTISQPTATGEQESITFSFSIQFRKNNGFLFEKGVDTLQNHFKVAVVSSEKKESRPRLVTD